MTEGERLREVRTALGLTLEKFGASLNVTKVAISNIENGNRTLTDRMCADVCRVYNVDEMWLRTGEGEMFRRLTRRQQIARFAGEVAGDDPDSFRSLFVSVLAELGPEEWEVLHGIAQKFIALNEQREQEN